MSARNVIYWLDLAQYDFDTAIAMYKTERWLYVAFMCHQVIEKMLKAYWCSKRDDDPPYTHSHQRIAQGTGIWDKMTDKQRDFIETVTTFNIETRYPRYKEQLASYLSRETCSNIIEETKELKEWIEGLLSAKTRQ